MNIAVVDVAAKSSGALSVLSDFLHFIENDAHAQNNQWFVFTSVPLTIHADHIHIIVEGKVKKTWLHRLYWEHFQAAELLKKYSIDKIISFQNTALQHTNLPQAVYFHNALLLEPAGKYSLLKSEERSMAVYSRFVAPFTLRSLSYAEMIFVQTQTIKRALEKKLMNLGMQKNIQVVRPNVKLPKITATQTNQIKGFIYPAAPLKYKNHNFIMDALEGLPELCNQKDFEIIFTFTGMESAFAKALAKRAEKFPCIKLTGFLPRDKVFDFYLDHGLLFVSELETFFIPFAEAMSLGCPILSCSSPLAQEVLNDYGNVVWSDFNNMSMQMALRQYRQLYTDSKCAQCFCSNSWEWIVKFI